MLILDTEQMNEDSGLDRMLRDWASKLRIRGRGLWVATPRRESNEPAETHEEPEVPDRATGLIL